MSKKDGVITQPSLFGGHPNRQIANGYDGKFDLSDIVTDYAWGGLWSDLVKQGYTQRQAAVIAWLSSPKQNRQPRTKGELSTLIGVNAGRLSDYVKMGIVTTKVAQLTAENGDIKNAP